MGLQRKVRLHHPAGALLVKPCAERGQAGEANHSRRRLWLRSAPVNLFGFRRARKSPHWPSQADLCDCATNAMGGWGRQPVSSGRQAQAVPGFPLRFPSNPSGCAGLLAGARARRAAPAGDQAPAGRAAWQGAASSSPRNRGAPRPLPTSSFELDLAPRSSRVRFALSSQTAGRRPLRGVPPARRQRLPCGPPHPRSAGPSRVHGEGLLRAGQLVVQRRRRHLVPRRAHGVHAPRHLVHLLVSQSQLVGLDVLHAGQALGHGGLPRVPRGLLGHQLAEVRLNITYTKL